MLLVTALVLGGLVALAASLVMGHAVWGAIVAPRRRRLLDQTRAAVLESLFGTPAGAAATSLGRLPQDLRIRVLGELAASLGGAGREQLTQLAREVGLLEAAEALCRSRRWWRRLRGVRLLTMLGGGESVVPPLLRDPDPAVRAQAAEWAADHPLPQVTEALLALLGDPTSLCRAAVQDSLLRMGARAAEPLARYLASASGIGCEGALEVAAGSPDTRFLRPALTLAGDPSPRLRSRAAALLGALGGPEAVAALTVQLADPAPEGRAAAGAPSAPWATGPPPPGWRPCWATPRGRCGARRASPCGRWARRASCCCSGRSPARTASPRTWRGSYWSFPPAPGGILAPVSGGRA